jgi:carbon storage regulator CsrA
MLVLSRKVGEVIELGNGIAVTVLEIKGQRVRLGIAAPETVSILRQELGFDRINGTAIPDEVNDRCDDRKVSCVRKSR